MLSNEKLIKHILVIPTEDNNIEFKRLGNDLKVAKVIESIVAMANTDGGFIIFGVDDPEKTKLKGIDRIYGIEESLEKFDEIGRELQRITPPIPSLWSPLKISCSNGKTIAVLEIFKSTNTFHSIDKHVFVRLEKSNKLLSPHEIIKFSYAKGFEHADRELVDIDFDLLKTEYYELWKTTRKILDTKIEEALFHTGLARKNENGKLMPTRAAVLLFALHPHDIMDTKCALRIFQYEGTLEKINTTLNTLSVPRTIEGPIIKQIREAHEYVLTLLRAGMKIPSSGFLTTYNIPERAVKEAITNALIHRDYYIKRDIEISIFEDRLEVKSPGLLPFNITPNNIGTVRAEGYRNDLLVKHLREFPNPPNLDKNEGVRAMRMEMDNRNLYPPIFLTYPTYQDSVEVILISAIKATEWDKVFDYMKKEKFVTNEKVRSIINNPDTSKVSRLLKRWVDQKLLYKIETGAKKTIKYGLAVDGGKDDLFQNESINKDKL
jgi:ATP-dependent DNA helicase RecG